MIIVDSNAVIKLSSAPNTDAQTVCKNSAITDIVYTISGTGSNASIDWSPSVPSGTVTGNYNNTTHQFIISGIPAETVTFDVDQITVTGKLWFYNYRRFDKSTGTP